MVYHIALQSIMMRVSKRRVGVKDSYARPKRADMPAGHAKPNQAVARRTQHALQWKVPQGYGIMGHEL